MASVAIGRAVYFGPKVPILNEPTSALGVQAGLYGGAQHHPGSRKAKERAKGLRHRREVRNLGVIFITHNVHQAYPMGGAFTMLDRGRTLGTFKIGGHRGRRHRRRLRVSHGRAALAANLPFLFLRCMEVRFLSPNAQGRGSTHPCPPVHTQRCGADGRPGLWVCPRAPKWQKPRQAAALGR
jgi:hypothetical protein